MRDMRKMASIRVEVEKIRKTCEARGGKYIEKNAAFGETRVDGIVKEED